MNENRSILWVTLALLLVAITIGFAQTTFTIKDYSMDPEDPTTSTVTYDRTKPLIDTADLSDAAVTAVKTDPSIAKTADVYNKQEVDSKLGDLASELMKNDGSNALTTVAFPGDITSVNASFTGAVEAGGVELMKNDGSNDTAGLFDIVIDKYIATNILDFHSSADVVIPATYGGRNVKTISNEAFRNKDIATSLVISEGVENIGASAFRRETADTPAVFTLTIPSTLKTVGAAAFLYSGVNNTSLVFPDSIESLGLNCFAFIKTYGGGAGVSSITFPNNPAFTSIPEGLVRESTGDITVLNIPSSVTVIYAKAFGGHPVVDITIGARVNINSDATTMGSNAGFRDYYLSQSSTAGNYLWNGTAWTGPF